MQPKQKGLIMPIRHQRKRTKGWRKPEGAIIVDRTSKWGNPYTVEAAKHNSVSSPHQHAVDAFENWLKGNYCKLACNDINKLKTLRKTILTNIHQLKGKDLVCFCPLDKPCHADVLIRMANEQA